LLALNALGAGGALALREELQAIRRQRWSWSRNRHDRLSRRISQTMRAEMGMSCCVEALWERIANALTAGNRAHAPGRRVGCRRATRLGAFGRGPERASFFRLVSAAGKRCSRSRAASARRCASKDFWPFFGANCASRFFCCCRG